MAKKANKPKKKMPLSVKMGLLTTAVLAGAILFVVFGYVSVHKTMENAHVSAIRFSNPEDTLQHVTADFSVPLTISGANGKEHKVTWSSKSSLLTIGENGEVKVKVPEKNQRVSIKETYRWLIFKASRSYSVTLTTNDVQTYDNLKVVSVDEVLNGTYEDRMDVGLDEDGNVRFLFGDFGEATVNNKGDAAAFVEKYRETLSIPDCVDIELSNFTSSDMTTTYCFDIYYEGIKVGNDKIYLAINNEDCTPKKITCDITGDFSAMSADVDLDEEDYKKIVCDAYSLESDSVVVEDVETLILDQKVCERVRIASNEVQETQVPTSVTIDKASGEIIRESFPVNAKEKELSGEDEFGNKLTFMGTKDDHSNYLLKDMNRNIEAYRHAWTIDSDSSLSDYDKRHVETITDPTYGYDYPVLDGMVQWTAVFSQRKKFSEELAVDCEMYHAAQVTYDNYYELFGRQGFDGKNGKLTLFYDDAGGIFTDNMQYLPEYHIIKTLAAEDYITTCASDPKSTAHEYSHAVVYSVLDSVTFDGAKYNEGPGINEAYADILAIFTGGDFSWKLFSHTVTDEYAQQHPDILKSYGTTFYARELDTMDLEGWALENTYSRRNIIYYDDELFSDEGTSSHICGRMLGYIAYQMWESGYYTQEQLAKIWYESLMLGYIPDEATFYDVRRNVLEAMEEQGYGTLEKDSVAYFFDERHIFDPDYTITSAEYLNGETGEASEEGSVFSTNGDQSEGDPIMDDSGLNRYFVVFSPISCFKQEADLFIFETPAEENDYNGLSNVEIGEQIETYINSDAELKKDKDELYETLRDLLSMLGIQWGDPDKESRINVVYIQVPSSLMDTVVQLVEVQKDYMVERMSEAIGLDTEESSEESVAGQIIDLIVQAVIETYTVESTAYDFYHSL